VPPARISARPPCPAGSDHLGVELRDQVLRAAAGATSRTTSRTEAGPDSATVGIGAAGSVSRCPPRCLQPARSRGEHRGHAVEHQRDVAGQHVDDRGRRAFVGIWTMSIPVMNFSIPRPGDWGCRASPTRSDLPGLTWPAGRARGLNRRHGRCSTRSRIDDEQADRRQVRKHAVRRPGSESRRMDMLPRSRANSAAPAPRARPPQTPITPAAPG
jgi:hypothetical protein